MSGEPDAYRLRPLAPADVDRLVALDAACFSPKEAYPRWLLRRYLAQANASGLAAEADAETGSGIAAFVLVEWDEDVGHVVTLDVDAAHRRGGLGRRLMEAAHALLVDRGARRVILEVDVDNKPAIALYRALHYKALRRFREDGKQRYVMGREL